MKKNFLMFTVASVLMTTSSCDFTSETQAPKNYYGVQSDENKTPQKAYITLFCVIVGLCIFILWGIKRLKK